MGGSGGTALAGAHGLLVLVHDGAAALMTGLLNDLDLDRDVAVDVS